MLQILIRSASLPLTYMMGVLILMSTHNIGIFLWRNKKNINTSPLEKVPYLELKVLKCPNIQDNYCIYVIYPKFLA